MRSISNIKIELVKKYIKIINIIKILKCRLARLIILKFVIQAERFLIRITDEKMNRNNFKNRGSMF